MANISKINRRAEKEKQQNNNSDTVTKLNASNGVVVGAFAVGDGPFGIAFDGSSLWVANFGSSNVMKLTPDGMLA